MTNQLVPREIVKEWEVLQQRAVALGHTLDDILCTLEHSTSDEEAAADRQCVLDAKRFRCLMLVLDDKSAADRVENSGIFAMDEEPSSEVSRTIVDDMIRLLEDAEYTI